jgi:hypothetical protein
LHLLARFEISTCVGAVWLVPHLVVVLFVYAHRV